MWIQASAISFWHTGHHHHHLSLKKKHVSSPFFFSPFFLSFPTSSFFPLFSLSFCFLLTFSHLEFDSEFFWTQSLIPKIYSFPVYHFIIPIKTDDTYEMGHYWWSSGMQDWDDSWHFIWGYCQISCRSGVFKPISGFWPKYAKWSKVGIEYRSNFYPS